MKGNSLFTEKKNEWNLPSAASWVPLAVFHMLFYSSPCEGQDSFCKQKLVYNSQRALSAAQNTENVRVLFHLHDLTLFVERKKKSISIMKNSQRGSLHIAVLEALKTTMWIINRLSAITIYLQP